jgi:uncharacterized protein
VRRALAGFSLRGTSVPLYVAEAYNHSMKYIPVCLILGVTLFSCVAPARADEVSKSAKAAELLQLVQGDQIIKAMEPIMKGMMAQAGKDIPEEQRAKAGEMQEKIMAMVAARWRQAAPALVKVYSDTYSEQELDGILAFYKSPVGKSFLQKTPEVMQRSMPVMMQMMTDMQPEMKALIEGMQKSK